MPSKFFADILEKESSKATKGSKLPVKRGKVEYSVITGDRRKYASEHTVSEVTFSVSQGALDAPVAVSAMSKIAEYLDIDDIGAVDNILASFGFGKVPKTKREAGTTEIKYTEDPEVVGAKYRSGRTDIGIQTTSGKFTNATNLRSLLQILVRKYILEDMTRASAPLKYRTGRFANTVELKNPALSPKATQVSLFYTYMIKPYSVFDPRFGNAKASPGRNPQRIIGEALEKAAKDIIHAKYRVVVRQANQAFSKGE